MFQRQPKDLRPSVNQVSMIQSRFEHQNNDFFEAVKLPATIFRRSPLRQRTSNPNCSTSRHGTPVKKSPSPIMSRRDSNVSTRSFLNSQAQPAPLIKTSKMRMTVRQPAETLVPAKEQMLEIVGNIRQVPVIKTDRDPPTDAKYCSNKIHDVKVATFSVKNQNNQQLLYCEKCAILLASQGFQVVKIDQKPQQLQNSYRSLSTSLESTNMRNQALNQLQNTQRRSELTLFLNDIKSLFYQFRERKNEVKSIVMNNKSASKDLDKTITNYFNQLMKIIEIQKNMILEDLEIERKKVIDDSEVEIKELNQYMDDCSMMSDDIFSSIDLIRHIDDKAFRKVMETYKTKTKNYVQFLNKPLPILMTKENIESNDLKIVSKKIMELTQVRFNSEKKDTGENKVLFSFDKQKQESKNDQNNHGNREEEKQYEVDERFIKKFDDSNDS